MKYDLLTEPWIPIEGRSVGLLELVDVARDTEMVVCPPLEQAAILRLFVAILISSCGRPSKEEVVGWLEDGIPRDRVRRYLYEHAEEFDLMGESRPFMQTGRSEYVSNPGIFSWRPPLVLNGAQKNNSILFNKCGDWDAPEPMLPDRAARLLLAHNAFVTGGGKVGKSAGRAIYLCGGPLGGRSCYMLVGDNIEKTAVLNAVSEGPVGRPLWETGDVGLGTECDPEGLLEWLTWPSRGILLEWDDNGFLTGMQYTQGKRTGPDAHDPMCIRPGDSDPVLKYRRKFKLETALFRNLTHVLGENGPETIASLRMNVLPERLGKVFLAEYGFDIGEQVAKLNSSGCKCEKLNTNLLLDKGALTEYTELVGIAEDVGTVIRHLPSAEKKDEQNMHGSKKGKDSFNDGPLSKMGKLLEASYWDRLDYLGSMLMGGPAGSSEWKKEVELAAERTIGEYRERSCMPLRMEETRTMAMSKIRRLVRGQ